jgi:hypothetical protein
LACIDGESRPAVGDPYSEMNTKLCSEGGQEMVRVRVLWPSDNSSLNPLVNRIVYMKVAEDLLTA